MGDLQALARELGVEDSVRFLGVQSREQVADLMQRSRCLALPSSSEGWGMVVAESLACGTPVVASRVGGVPEILREPAGASSWRLATSMPCVCTRCGARAGTDGACGCESEWRATVGTGMPNDPPGLRRQSRAPAPRPIPPPGRADRHDPLRSLRHHRPCDPREVPRSPSPSTSGAQGWRVDALANGAANACEIESAFDQRFDVDWSRNPLAPRNLLGSTGRIRAIVADESLRHRPRPHPDCRMGHEIRASPASRRRSGRTAVVYTAHGFHFYKGQARLPHALFRTMERSPHRGRTTS